jgi:hypothetical protein
LVGAYRIAKITNPVGLSRPAGFCFLEAIVGGLEYLVPCTLHGKLQAARYIGPIRQKILPQKYSIICSRISLPHFDDEWMLELRRFGSVAEIEPSSIRIFAMIPIVPLWEANAHDRF